MKFELDLTTHLNISEIFLIERLRENLADPTRNIFNNLYHNRLDGPIACHVLVQNSRFLKIFLVEIGQVFPQPLCNLRRIIVHYSGWEVWVCTAWAGIRGFQGLSGSSRRLLLPRQHRPPPSNRCRVGKRQLKWF